jgi:uncharacterized YigZ family protein
MADTYKTIAGPAEGSVTEQRSKFIAYALPVQSTDKIKTIVDQYRKQYYDARHVCWAYVLGAQGDQFRVNDDGEPSSTAGKPILGVIRSAGLTQILIVVIRYFGGVKLGTGGLIAAYRAAAQEAVDQAEMIEKTVEETLIVECDYSALHQLLKIVKEEQATLLSQTIENTCTLTLSIRQSEVEKFQKRLKQVPQVQIN